MEQIKANQEDKFVLFIYIRNMVAERLGYELCAQGKIRFWEQCQNKRGCCCLVWTNVEAILLTQSIESMTLAVSIRLSCFLKLKLSKWKLKLPALQHRLKLHVMLQIKMWSSTNHLFIYQAIWFYGTCAKGNQTGRWNIRLPLAYDWTGIILR